MKEGIISVKMRFGPLIDIVIMIVGLIIDSLAGLNSRIAVGWKLAERESRECRIYRGTAAEIPVAIGELVWKVKANTSRWI